MSITNCPHSSDERHGSETLQNLLLDHMRDCQLHTARRNTPRHVVVCMECGVLACTHCGSETTLRIPQVADGAWACKVIERSDAFTDDHRACLAPGLAMRDPLSTRRSARKGRRA